MNVLAELERLTEPPFRASEVRRLSPEEIGELAASGQITSLDQIPMEHMAPRQVVPLRCGRGMYYYQGYSRRG